MPSHVTLKWLGASTLLACLLCFPIFAGDYDCGAQSWDCTTYFGIAVVTVTAGLVLGLLLTAVIVVLGWIVLWVRPLAPVPEPRSRAARVALTLMLLHLMAFGALHAMGVLPIGWLWWLGVFGATGMDASGTTYIFVPTH
jgi:hypothetical protein